MRINTSVKAKSGELDAAKPRVLEIGLPGYQETNMIEKNTIIFDAEYEFVEVRVSVEATREDRCNLRDSALRLCKEKNCSRLLVDLRQMNPSSASSTMQSYGFGEDLAKKSIGIHIAHVLGTDNKTNDNTYFMSTVATNRGALTMEFNSIENAKEWLLGKRASIICTDLPERCP
jgi:hypothetical protein